MLLTMPRERAMRAKFESEFRRVAASAAALAVTHGSPEQAAGHGHNVQVKRLLTSAYAEGMPAYGKLVLDAGGKAAKPKTAFEALVIQWIEEVSMRRVQQITATTREQLRSIVAGARSEGLGTSAIASRIRDAFGDTIGKARASTIARTETHSAANAAQLFAAESLGRQNMKREWIAAEDERTREDHANADGQVVALEQPFEVGGELLMYPGDAGGSPEQIINCRCTTGFIAQD